MPQVERAQVAGAKAGRADPTKSIAVEFAGKGVTVKRV
jgi:hypothetical protein